MSNSKNTKLTFGKGSSALTHMDEFMEKHAGEIEELEQQFGKDESDVRSTDNTAIVTKTTIKKAA